MSDITWTAEGDYRDILYAKTEGTAKITINRPSGATSSPRSPSRLHAGRSGPGTVFLVTYVERAVPAGSSPAPVAAGAGNGTGHAITQACRPSTAPAPQARRTFLSDGASEATTGRAGRRTYSRPDFSCIARMSRKIAATS